MSYQGKARKVLSCYIGIYSRKVVGWSRENNMRLELTETAFKHVLWNRKLSKGLTVHICQGRVVF